MEVCFHPQGGVASLAAVIYDLCDDVTLIMWLSTSIFTLPVCIYSQVFRMVAGGAGVSEDSSSRQPQPWRWRALRNQPSWTWIRAWLWPASPSFACCWWPWSSAARRSSWTPTVQSPPPHGRNSTWMTDTLKSPHRKGGSFKSSVVRQPYFALHFFIIQS